MQKSKIEWTETTWNPVIGCSRVSRECVNCYAETMAHRFSGPGKYAHRLTVVGNNGPRWSGVVRPRPEKLSEPLRWRRPRVFFVNSMSDLFHEKVPDEFIGQVFEVMTKLAKHHVYQVLTKRAERLADLAPSLPWTPNVWMGVSVGTADAVGLRRPLLHRLAPPRHRRLGLLRFPRRREGPIFFSLGPRGV